jgi:hypothetical protein
MAKNAEDRYQSAWGIKADLEIGLHQFAQTDKIDGIQLGLQDVCDQFQIPQKLYGREAEIEALLAAFDRVAQTRNEELRVKNQENSQFLVEMMLVSGYAGVGKSALVQAENTQQILQLAACIGAEFNLNTLAIVCKQSPKAISLDLLAAIQAGLIQPISELDESLLDLSENSKAKLSKALRQNFDICVKT